MIELSTQVDVEGVNGRQITDFLLHPNDEAYRRWWPGTHLSFHTSSGVPGSAGSVVQFDEFVGGRRFAMQGVVLEVCPGKRVVWQLKRGIALPAWLLLELEDHARGVTIKHTIRAGARGVWRIFDPLLRLFLTPRFCASMDDHARTEFRRLGELLSPGQPQSEARS
jgi:hypothetical protein